MVEAMKTNRKGLIVGLPPAGQLATQAAAVTPSTLTDSGVINEGDVVVTLNKAAGAMAITLARPDPGRVLVITQIDAGTHGHTVTLASGTFDGTNNRATLNAQNETLVLYGISDRRFLILLNVGSVGLSAV